MVVKRAGALAVGVQIPVQDCWRQDLGLVMSPAPNLVLSSVWRGFRQPSGRAVGSIHMLTVVRGWGVVGAG